MQKPDAQGASGKTRQGRSLSRPTTLVVHSRFPEVRFRILSTQVPPHATELPVSSLSRHRTCQKAMDCDGYDETSGRD
jgi:hypothetical protein